MGATPFLRFFSCGVGAFFSSSSSLSSSGGFSSSLSSLLSLCSSTPGGTGYEQEQGRTAHISPGPAQPSRRLPLGPSSCWGGLALLSGSSWELL